MSIKGSPYANFRRALASGNLLLIRAAAAELPAVNLEDALEVCLVLAEREPDRLERAAIRWVGRYCLERPATTLVEIRALVDAFSHLSTDADGASAQLRGLISTRPIRQEL